MSTFIQDFLANIQWYERARQGFLMLCAASFFSIGLILGLPAEALSVAAVRLAIASAPALAFLLSFAMPLPLVERSFILYVSQNAAADVLLAVGLFFLSGETFSWDGATGFALAAGLAAALGAGAGWVNLVLARRSRPAQLSLFITLGDMPKILEAAFVAARACWAELNPQIHANQDALNALIVFENQKCLTIEIEQEEPELSPALAPTEPSPTAPDPVASHSTHAPSCLVTLTWRPGSSIYALPKLVPLSQELAFRSAMAHAIEHVSSPPQTIHTV
jgi:hypothetical protein